MIENNGHFKHIALMRKHCRSAFLRVKSVCVTFFTTIKFCSNNALVFIEKNGNMERGRETWDTLYRVADRIFQRLISYSRQKVFPPWHLSRQVNTRKKTFLMGPLTNSKLIRPCGFLEDFISDNLKIASAIRGEG